MRRKIIIRCKKCNHPLKFNADRTEFWCTKCLQDYYCPLINDELMRSYFRGLSQGKLIIAQAISNILKHPNDVH